MAKDGSIGMQGGLPWHLPAELHHFKRVTEGRAVVMGRKTWQSLPGPLTGEGGRRCRGIHAVPVHVAGLVADQGGL